jgi:hypothetical protein
MAKFCQNADLCRKVKSTQFSPIQPPGHSLIAVTHNPLTVWSNEMDHQKAERVFYHDGIWYFRSFGQSETRKLSSVQPLFCPETEISSEVDLWNSVTSKPLGG